MKWVLGYLCAVCILVSAVCASIALPTFYVPFYRYEYNKYGISETIRVPKDELIAVTRHLLDYMQGKQEDLTVYATVAGEPREFFNQREKDHMVDVRNLFDIGFKVRNTAFWAMLLLLLLMIFIKADVLTVLARCCREIFTGFIILTGILVTLVILDFNRAFTIFHVLFFDNDLWQLNPETDLLVNIVPIGFFMDIATTIAVLLSFMLLIIILLSTLYLHKTKPLRLR